MLKIASVLFLLVTCAPAQTSSKLLDINRHAWYSYSGDHSIAGPWGVHFDAQWRRAELGRQWQQYQLRPAVNFAWSRNVLLTAGYAFTKAYPYGEFPVQAAFPEHRIYQQALVRRTWGSVRFQHRLRLEQRFIRYPSPETRSWTYQNRFRYLLKAEVPIGTTGNGAKWYVPIFNEILLGIPPNYGSRSFDQNRLFAGIGRSTGLANIEVGYMNQFIGQRNGRIFEMNNTLFVTVTSNVPLSQLWGK